MSKEEIITAILISVAFIGLVVLFCILLVKLYIRKVKTYTQQLYQKDLDFQKTLTTTVIETQEQVLNNISHDLHDDIGQQLTVINFHLEHLKLDSPELSATLNPVSESLRRVSQSIRGISHALSNQLVVQQDLLRAIAAEMKRLQNNTKMDFSCSFPSKSKRDFTANEKIIIYRIFQECINNSLKHSKASSLAIAVKTVPLFEMTITDNGIGFETNKKTSKSALGLLNMESRARSIDYDFTINSTPGTGTTITLTENKTA